MQTPDEFELLENLLKHKKFAQLTAAEKSLVLKHIGSEDAYTAMQITEQQLAHTFQKPLMLSPRQDFTKQLHTQLQANKPQPFINRIATYQIPVYQAIAAMLVLTGILFWYIRPTDQSQSQGLTSSRDTIFVTQHDTIVKENTVYVTRYKTVVRVLPNKPRFNVDTTGISVPEQIKNPPAQGVSMKEDTLLSVILYQKRQPIIRLAGFYFSKDTI